MDAQRRHSSSIFARQRVFFLYTLSAAHAAIQCSLFTRRGRSYRPTFRSDVLRAEIDLLRSMERYDEHLSFSQCYSGSYLVACCFHERQQTDRWTHWSNGVHPYIRMFDNAQRSSDWRKTDTSRRNCSGGESSYPAQECGLLRSALRTRRELRPLTSTLRRLCS